VSPEAASAAVCRGDPSTIMKSTRAHDPLALFAFALRERDWVLADLIAETHWRATPARREFERVLREAEISPSPGSLERLHLWAELARLTEREVRAGR